MAINRPNNRFFNRAFRLQASTPPAIEHPSFASGTRQDAQINYLSTLSIFMKQTTYLATLPNPNLKANECHCF
jgi:hypothetical protein